MKTFNPISRFFGKAIPAVLLLLCVVISCQLYSCRNIQKSVASKKIMVSIEPLRYFTEQLAGDKFEVQSIVPDGYNPENYKPTPEQLMELDNCKVFFKIGQLGFETTWLEKACVEQPDLKVVDTSDSIRINHNGMQMASFDPHTWTSPKNVMAICKSICQTLCEIDSVNAEFYQGNLTILLDKIGKTDEKLHEILADIPSRTFITVHPALTYFANSYGLCQLPIEKEGAEPTPSDLKDLIRQSKNDKALVILIQKQFSRTQAEIISKETGAKIVEINPLGYNWNEEMIRIANALHDGK